MHMGIQFKEIYNMQHMYFAMGLALLCSAVVYAADAGLKPGDAAPDVGAPDETGKEVKLSSFKDKSAVVVFFYPKADTPGCTKESCAFRDDAKDFEAKGYVLLGASRDTPEAQTKFKEKYHLNFPLLSDPKGELATSLGLTPGKRQSIVIGKDGKVAKVYLNVTPATHAKDLLKELEPAK